MYFITIDSGDGHSQDVFPIEAIEYVGLDKGFIWSDRWRTPCLTIVLKHGLRFDYHGDLTDWDRKDEPEDLEAIEEHRHAKRYGHLKRIYDVIQRAISEDSTMREFHLSTVQKLLRIQ